MRTDLARTARTARSRRRLQGALAALVTIPLVSAGREIMLGPAGVPGGSAAVTPTVDSALRYANVYKAAIGLELLAPPLLLVWQLRIRTAENRIERS